ncbi:MAG: hypothetical protein QNJ97_25310 [Myxococcota bacterium]|nr:hypothetical protein [Myxococcota bacterium]
MKLKPHRKKMKRAGLPVWLPAVVAIALLNISFDAYAAGPCAASQPCQRAVSVAQDGFKDFLDRALTPHAKKMHALAPQDNSHNAALGRPYLLHEIIPEKVNRCVNQTCGSPQSLSTPFEVYMFPVLFDGDIKLMLTVYKNQKTGEFQIGSLGDKWLARELSAILALWPTGQYPLELYKSNQAQTYAFSIPSYATPNLTLIDPENRDTADYRKLTPLADVVGVLKTRIARMLQGEE